MKVAHCGFVRLDHKGKESFNLAPNLRGEVCWGGLADETLEVAYGVSIAELGKQ